MSDNIHHRRRLLLRHNHQRHQASGHPVHRPQPITEAGYRTDVGKGRPRILEERAVHFPNLCQLGTKRMDVTIDTNNNNQHNNRIAGRHDRRLLTSNANFLKSKSDPKDIIIDNKKAVLNTRILPLSFSRTAAQKNVSFNENCKNKGQRPKDALQVNPSFPNRLRIFPLTVAQTSLKPRIDFDTKECLTISGASSSSSSNQRFGRSAEIKLYLKSLNPAENPPQDEQSSVDDDEEDEEKTKMERVIKWLEGINQEKDLERVETPDIFEELPSQRDTSIHVVYARDAE